MPASAYWILAGRDCVDRLAEEESEDRDAYEGVEVDAEVEVGRRVKRGEVEGGRERGRNCEGIVARGEGAGDGDEVNVDMEEFQEPLLCVDLEKELKIGA